MTVAPTVTPNPLPTVITKAGLQPTPPADLRKNLVDIAVGLDPGLTANLPGSLIEDIASTDVGALVVIDQARVDLVNSLSPFGSNDFLTTQLGNVYGVPEGLGSNGSVFVVFDSPNAGFAIPQGFTVTDGTNQFILQEGGIVPAGGTTDPLFALASLPGVFPIPENTVNALVTSLPEGITLTVNNPEAGTPAQGAQSPADYRAQVLQAGLAASSGMARYLKTLLAPGKIPGVVPRLVSVRLVIGEDAVRRWEVICGGGDPYDVANAIFMAVFDLGSLTGSVLEVEGITNGNPGVVTTNLNHGLVTGQSNVFLSGVEGMTTANGGPYTVNVIDGKHFSFGVNTTLFDPYTGGGVVTPNARNIVVSINDYPDVYNVPYVNPPQQSVAITVTWNTTAVNFVADASVAQLGSLAISNYVDSIPVGLPINLFEMEAAFIDAISGVVPAQLVSRLLFTVSIDGVGVSPDAGTGLYEGDPESYFQMTQSQVIVTRG